jgi:glycosyltransferase involved in cell wall biosynthesis
MPLAGIFKATHQRIPLVGIFSWISKPKKARVLKRVWSSFDKIILMSTVQYRCARETLQIPEDRLALLRWPVDLKFWRPMDIVPDKICAVGREMRDYGTLLKAMEGLPLHCHIAANAQPGVKDQWIQTLADPAALPPNVSVGAKNYKELRDLYAQSRFVVVPLHPTDTDNGTTSVLEAMAMGKAVICSRVEGQHGVIQEGKTGLFVPPEDPRALRSAMESLLKEPAKAEAMGREGRQWVERHHSLDTWVTQVKDIVDAVLETHRRKMDV